MSQNSFSFPCPPLLNTLKTQYEIPGNEEPKVTIKS